MKNSIARVATGMTLIAGSLLIYGCNKPAEKAGANQPLTEAFAQPAKTEKMRFMTAAEPFEVLTEAAASGDAKKIETAASAALASGNAMRTKLPLTVMPQFEKHLASIKRGQQLKDTTTIALSSNEAYRILVSASAGAASFPVEVSLLDYAGFRYDANLKAKPSRWADMTEATLFAERQWTQVEPKLKQPALEAEFGKVLTDMKKASATKDRELAASSVKVELDLVDKLETAFAKAR